MSPFNQSVPERSRKTRILTVLAAVLLALYLLADGMIISYLVSFGNRQIPQKSDVIIVLGADVMNDHPGKETAERLDKGMELLMQGYGKKVIVSGGKTPKNTMSDGLIMKDYLVQKGVAPEEVIAEEKARNTYENLLYSREIMKREGFNSAVLVSTHYHLLRALTLARAQGLEATASASPDPEIRSIKDLKYLNYWVREVPALVKNALQHKIKYW